MPMPIPDSRRRPLSQLPRQLRKFSGHAVTYQGVYTATINGAVPEVVWVNGRYYYDDDDVPVIAARLGLPVQEDEGSKAAESAAL